MVSALSQVIGAPEPGGEEYRLWLYPAMPWVGVASPGRRRPRPITSSVNGLCYVLLTSPGITGRWLWVDDRWVLGDAAIRRWAAEHVPQSLAQARQILERAGSTVTWFPTTKAGPPMPTNDARLARMVDVLTGLDIPPEVTAGETEHDKPAPRRFMLIEKNSYGEPPWYVTTHDTAEAAGAYHWGQEHYADWAITAIVDLDTGDRYEVEQVYVARLLEPAEPEPAPG